MLSKNGICLRAAAQYVLVFFSTCGKFRLVSNLTELHALTQAAVLMRSSLVLCGEDK